MVEKDSEIAATSLRLSLTCPVSLKEVVVIYTIHMKDDSYLCDINVCFVHVWLLPFSWER